MYAYPSLRFMRSAFLGILCLVAMLLSGAAPATAQTADPRWGYLAELAEHDFVSSILISTWRWKVPNQIIAHTLWGLGGHRVTEFELEPASGTIIVRSFYETRRNDFETETGWRAGADRVLTSKGKIYITKSPTGGYDWGKSTFLPIGPGHQREASVAKIIARGELRAANPGLMSAIQVAHAAQAADANAGPAVTQWDPRWGILSELVEHDFEANKFPLTVRWIIPGQSIQFTMWAVLGRTNFDIAIDPLTGQLMEAKKPLTVIATGELLSQDGKPMLSRSGPDQYLFQPSGYKMSIRPLRDETLSKMIASRVASGKVPAANPSLKLTPIQSVAQVAPTTAVPNTVVVETVAGPSQGIAIVTSGPRLALVIGNSTYGPSMGALPNPANDADAMAAALKSLGFTVHLVKNADQNTMKRAIVRFGQRLTTAGKGATGLFFYAGHGIQHRGINYLVPVSAQISSQADVDIEAVAADTVLQQMEEAGASTNIVILDACRNMPLVRGFRSASAGLAPMDAPNGSFIAYSTAPGSVAADGAGANSPFVTALIRNIGRKGESIEGIFRDVRRSVRSETEGAQTPWDSSSLVEPFYFAQP